MGDKKNRRIQRPIGRKRMIRDLPIELAKYLHPSLRSILVSRQRRWNRGSPHFRIAVNLINRYRRQIKPRVLPFFCDRCHLATRRLNMALHHPCDEDDRKRTERRDNNKKCVPYDFSQDVKMAQNAHKFLRKDGLAIMERTPKPQHIPLMKSKRAEKPKTVQIIKKIPKLQELCCFALEFDDPVDCVPIDECCVVIPSTSNDQPENKFHDESVSQSKKEHQCMEHVHPGTFCFRCKVLFENYNEYSKHLEDEMLRNCSGALPEYQTVELTDRTGLVPNGFDYRNRRHRPVKRNISHIKCTSCRAGNFESTDALYSHMLKCESQ